jgi:PAS domain S-box-containing protein
VPGARAASSRTASIRRRVITLLAAYALLTAAVLAALLLYLRSDAVASGQKVLAGFAELAGEQTTRTLQGIEQTLQSAEAIRSAATDAGTVTPDQLRREFHDLLEDRPFLTGIRVIDKEGRIVHGPVAGEAGRNVSDREYFSRQRDNPGSGLLWGMPIKARSTGQWIVTATLPIRAANGQFDGLIVGSVPLAFFDHVWKFDDDDIRGLAIALWRDDGVLLMRSPIDERVMGLATMGPVLFSRIREGHVKGRFDTVSTIDGLQRLVVFRRLDAYPSFILTFSQSIEEALAAWWQAVWIVAAGWAIAAATVGALAIWTAREWAKRHAIEGRYRILFDSNPSPMLVADRNTQRFLAANDAAVEQYGWSRNELLTMGIDNLYPAEDVPAMTALRQQIVAGSGQTTSDLRHRKKDGTAIDIERNMRLIDFEGRPALLAILQDVTLRKAAEKHLAQMESQYRGLLEAAPDAMVVVNQAGEIVLVNVQAEKQFGYRRDELLGQQVTNIIPEGFAERLVTDATRSEIDALAQEIGTGIELSGRRKDGEAFPIEIMLSPLASPDGILVTAAIRNISVRKTAEKQLAQMEGRYRGLLEAAPDAMVVVNQAGEIVLVNVQAEKQFGYRRDELLGQRVTNIIPEGFAERLVTDATRSKADALAQEIGTGIELSGRRKDGETFPLEIMLSPLASPDGILVTAAIRNITLRKLSEDQLRQSQKMEAVGQLTGGIAHDFNNILFVILANTDALLEDESFSPSVADRLGQIDKAVQRAADLTRQLLAFSRKQPLRPQLTDLNDLATDTGKLLRRSLGTQIEIDAVLAEDLCVVNVDRSQFETALVNLCINARDAMPGGGRLLVETRNVTLDEEYCAVHVGAVPGDYAMLSVTDAGEGISRAVLSRVFEPFFTTKGVGKGTGLGLSMVYGFIKQSNGHVSIYSEVGRGTSVKLFLPRSDGVAEESISRGKASVPGGVERILVVEDEPQVRANVVQQLASLGYSVWEAPDGTAAIAAFEAASPPYDLLLSDVVMPGPMSGKLLGIEVARRWPTTKVVFMSGFTEISSVRHGRLDEGSMLLSKPFRKADLAQMIRRALDVADTTVS